MSILDASARRLLFVSACIMVSATGCVPFLDSGYDVLGNGTRARSPYVYMSRDRLRIDAPDDIDLEIHAVEPPGDALRIEIAMRVPAGRTARWVSTTVTYASREWDGPRSGDLSPIFDFSGGEWPATEGVRSTASGTWLTPAPPYVVTLGWTADGRNVLGDSHDPVAEFTVDLPLFDANGTIFDPGTITVRRYRRWVLGMIAQ